jgi:hypothetical protein
MIWRILAGQILLDNRKLVPCKDQTRQNQEPKQGTLSGAYCL